MRRSAPQAGQLVDLERALKSVADETRLRILVMLTDGPLCVCQVVAVLGLSQSTVSKHLAVLSASRLLAAEKRGRWMFYSLADVHGDPFRHTLARLLARALGDDPVTRHDRAALRRRDVQALAAECPPATSKRAHHPSGVRRIGAFR